MDRWKNFVIYVIRVWLGCIKNSYNLMIQQTLQLTSRQGLGMWFSGSEFRVNPSMGSGEMA